MTTSYDEVRYPTRPHLHPDALAGPATLFGLTPAPLAACRVLEIGCGDGANLIPLAEALPEATFYGFDLAAEPVAEGAEAVAALGLHNIRLEARDILELHPERLGQFDYVVAHGMYSWIPAPVREAMIALIARVLAPHGVAFVSYAALPGCRLRQIVRDELLYHLRDLASPRERLQAIPRFLELLSAAYDGADSRAAAVKAECEDAAKRPPEVVFHDELSPFYTPVHLHEFMAHAERHGLRHFADLNPQELYLQLYPPPEYAGLQALAHGDPAAFHQYTDYLRLRMFRQSLVCRADAPVQLVDAQRLTGLQLSSRLRPADAGADADSTAPLRFQADEDEGVATTSPVLKRALLRLAEAAPGWLPFSELGDDPELAPTLLRLYAGGLLTLHTAPPPFTTRVSKRPQASAWARRQAAGTTGDVTNRRHTLLQLDATTRYGLTLLDGSRDREAVAEALAAHTGMPVEAIRAGLDANLAALAERSMLIA